MSEPKSPHKDYVGIVYDRNRTPKSDYPNDFARELVRRYAIAHGASFLEIGCGRGDFLNAFMEQGLDCRAVDRSDYCRTAGHTQCRFDVCDVEREPLPVEDNSLDVVYSKSLVEHMWDPCFLMSEIMRVLKPGGLCLTLTPDWVSQQAVFFEDYTHCRPYTVGALGDLMTASGFADVKSEIFCQHPLIWHSRPHKLLADGLSLVLGTLTARRLAEMTGIKFLRWAVERMVLASGRKPA